ncbi:hypothetical protein SAMN05443634_1095 [Chishuiella changwenlii]|jgi:predicted oxidoreductase|uniref:Lipoprotein n=1 Tax=Chishuiella changwenlii TaxID=1434701 RepID=A0A1M7AFA8_9FLAO|nr:hypothetical protein [Chishuiella changwenlii]GGE90119.1 hypothetical protein GCM10010984_04740 [Chishuiella changwenlii]SHL41316.1 hypothetical protein SAMN05443634_1095 [Chishuiella changwenlii]
MKRILLVGILLLLITACKKEPNFDEKGKEVFDELKDLSKISADANTTIYDVWNKAIFDKEYALCTSSKSKDCKVADASEAINRLIKEKSMVTLVKEINKKDSVIKLNLDSIAKHPNNDKDVYENLIDLYKNVKELSDDVKKPDGNIISFAQKNAQLNKDINLIVTEIEVRKPNWKTK